MYISIHRYVYLYLYIYICTYISILDQLRNLLIRLATVHLTFLHQARFRRMKERTARWICFTSSPGQVEMAQQIGVSINGGTPSHHPFLDGTFNELNHPLLGTPSLGHPQMHLWPQLLIQIHPIHRVVPGRHGSPCST